MINSNDRLGRMEVLIESKARAIAPKTIKVIASIKRQMGEVDGDQPQL